MDLLERKSRIDAARAEIKTRRARGSLHPPPSALVQQERNATIRLNQADHYRPKLPANATDEQIAAHRSAQRDFESNATRRGGFQLGESLRHSYEQREASGRRTDTPFGLPGTSEVHMRFVRRMNVQMQRRTGFSGRDGVQSSITPAERYSIGIGSRRRHVSPGLVPSGPPRRRG